jgi:hypothetical protein
MVAAVATSGLGGPWKSVVAAASPEGRMKVRQHAVLGAAMIQDVLSALWFITLLVVVYGMATGDLCLWRRDD